MEDTYKRLVEIYGGGQPPWDAELPPPEVLETVPALSGKRALDLGCGYGRTAIYLAQQGWQVDAIDFVPQAITVAQQRANVAKVTIHFHCANVTVLDFLQPPYDFGVDIGCAHSLPANLLIDYHKELTRLLSIGATYLLFARLQNTNDQDGFEKNKPRGIDETHLLKVFAKGFRLNQATHNLTEMLDGSCWQSAWYWFCRQA